MKTRIAVFTFTMISAAAFGLFIADPICAEPFTEIQSFLLSTQASHAVVSAARYDGGGGMRGGGAWHGVHNWSGRGDWHRPYRSFYRGGYIAPYYVAPYYVEPDCDNAVLDPYSGQWVCSGDLY